MKSYSPKPAPSKLVGKFDAELLRIIRQDLEAFYARNPNIRKASQQQQLIAA
ncbi:MAG: hypothetical protein V4592_12885 [Bacteroidota bacterium]